MCRLLNDIRKVIEMAWCRDTIHIPGSKSWNLSTILLGVSSLAWKVNLSDLQIHDLKMEKGDGG